MRVLVTGGTGFVGSHVLDVLHDRNMEPVVFDRHVKPGWPLAEETVLGDVRDPVAVAEAVKQCDGVIHLAGVLGTQETVDSPTPSVEVNVLGSLNVFTAVRGFDKPAVYITVGNHWMLNPYSITKTCAERLALMANAEWGTRIAVVRALNAYGPRQKSAPVRKIMPNLIIPALRDDVLTVYGDGSQVMDMIWVGDVAEILVDALTKEHGVYDHAFSAGTGRPTTVNDIASEVIRQTGRGRVEYLPMRPGEEPGAVVLGEPETLEPLGWELGDFVTLEDGIERTIAYYAGERVAA